MEQTKYDVFISYRRDGGAQYARILQLMLQQRGYKVFLDYDELTDGIFGDHIKAAIKDAPVFMLVLSEGSMERCVNETDWVRQEILLAAKLKKHIVPINPDNKFDGVPPGVPDEIKTIALSHQQSEIGFGQTMGVTIDLMVSKRLVPKLGERLSSNHVDTDYDSASETLKRIDRRNRFIKRVVTAGVSLVILIVLVACVLFFMHQKGKEQAAEQQARIEKVKTELQNKHKAFNLELRDSLSLEQMNTIDNILVDMVPIYPDSLWMSQFEFTVGQWQTLSGKPYNLNEKDLPITNVSYGDVMFFIFDLCDMTKITFDLPTVEEWEYAAHGGEFHESYLYVGDDDVDKVAWYKGNSGGKAHPSDGQDKSPNNLDLFDMSGNISELTKTPYAVGEDVPYTICGGNFDSPASEVTVSSRAPLGVNDRTDRVGFRLIIRKSNNKYQL